MQSETSDVEQILLEGDIPQVRALFEFDSSTEEDDVLMKFWLWSRWFYPKFFDTKDAPFHLEIDRRNFAVYRGKEDSVLQKLINYFLDIAFRGAAKTTRTKLFVAFCISNDKDHFRRYFKVLSGDIANSKQIVTDIYNMLILKRIQYFYPEIFAKTELKRQETMGVFTTAAGVKVQADTVGTEQRGDLQGEEESSRPDFLWFDDFETRKSLRSAVITEAIWLNMEEAKDGLSIDGGAIYNCNYLSERGNVHKLVQKFTNSSNAEVMITPIKGTIVNGVHIDGKPTWEDAYTSEQVETKLKNAEDPAGEYLCTPSAGLDVFFDRSCLERQFVKQPIRTVAQFKQFYEYDPSHRYGSGHDVAGGVGLDHSTSVFIDFHTIPNRVVATFKSNTIKPDVFGYEIIKECSTYGNPVCAIENNKFDMTIGVLKHQGYSNIYFTEEKETRAGIAPRTKYWGWNTNTMSKPKMLFDLKKAVEDGHLELTDSDIIAELRSYTRDDLMDRDEDARLTTRHFDLLIATAIAYQMRNWSEVAKPNRPYQQPAYQRTGLEE
jgi:hypothetical protein